MGEDLNGECRPIAAIQAPKRAVVRADSTVQEAKLDERAVKAVLGVPVGGADGSGVGADEDIDVATNRPSRGACSGQLAGEVHDPGNEGIAREGGVRIVAKGQMPRRCTRDRADHLPVYKPDRADIFEIRIPAVGPKKLPTKRRHGRRSLSIAGGNHPRRERPMPDGCGHILADTEHRGGIIAGEDIGLARYSSNGLGKPGIAERKALVAAEAQALAARSSLGLMHPTFLLHGAHGRPRLTTLCTSGEYDTRNAECAICIFCYLYSVREDSIELLLCGVLANDDRLSMTRRLNTVVDASDCTRSSPVSHNRDRLKSSFNETFALDFARIGYVLDAGASAADGCFTKTNEHIAMNLGVKMQEAYPRWAKGLGLIESSRGAGCFRLTAFGQRVAHNKPLMRDRWAQWLMHYHLAAPIGPGPEYWQNAFACVLSPTVETTKEDWRRSQALLFTAKRTSDQAYQTLGVAYGPAGLGETNLLDVRFDTRRSVQGITLSSRPDDVPLSVFAYALVDGWERSWGDRLTVGIDRLYERSDLAGVFHMTPPAINQSLDRLARIGWLQVHRVAPPYQIARRWTDFSEQKRRALEQASELDHA